MVDDIASGLSSLNGVDIVPRSAVRVGSAEVGLVDPIPRLAGMVVVDAEEVGEMACEFAHGLDRKADPKT